MVQRCSDRRCDAENTDRRGAINSMVLLLMGVGIEDDRRQEADEKLTGPRQEYSRRGWAGWSSDESKEKGEANVAGEIQATGQEKGTRESTSGRRGGGEAQGETRRCGHPVCAVCCVLCV